MSKDRKLSQDSKGIMRLLKGLTSKNLNENSKKNLDQNDRISTLDEKSLPEIINNQLSSGVPASDDLKKYVIDKIVTEFNKSSHIFVQAFLHQHTDSLIQFIGDTQIDANNVMMQLFVDKLSEYLSTNVDQAYHNFMLEPFTKKLNEGTLNSDLSNVQVDDLKPLGDIEEGAAEEAIAISW